MEADFSGYATKVGLKCSDGRTIMQDAFKDQDGTRVPLVWGHGHNDPEKVLGHAILTNREDGVWADGFFNDTAQGKNAKALVQHGDITFMSIYANRLVERAKQVYHGAIREVSLVIAGANPGAVIESVGLAHSDGTVEDLEDAGIIHTGIPVQVDTVDNTEEEENDIEHADDDAEPTVEEVFDSLDANQKKLFHFAVEQALQSAKNDESNAGEAKHSDVSEDETDTNNAGDEVDSVEEGPAVEVSPDTVDAPDSVETADSTEDSTEDQTDNEDNLNHQEGTIMGNPANVFENNGKTDKNGAEKVLSHDEMASLFNEAQKNGSLKETMLAHAGDYGVDEIDVLFPDAQTVTPTPELISRQMDWVQNVIGKTKHSPFARIKSTAADITADEARAKGYVKGNLKKDEVIRLLKRVTTPTTIYKKQKLDRDDIVDITTLDVVAWLKAEMRLMLNEEVARAILIGDGREPDDEDKVDEDKLRPIAYDDDMYAHKITLGSNSTPKEHVTAIVRARKYYRGTGTPSLYTTDDILVDLMLQEDKMGRRLYETEASLAAALRVSEIVVVEPMQDSSDLLAIIVNLTDYTVGADKGGQISMFDDFDIDYNQYKYLIETRISGALTKPKSALVIKRTTGIEITPEQPAFAPSTNTITIPTQTGVVYTIDGVAVTGDVVISETTEVEAEATTGYSFPHNIDTDWTYVYNPA